MMKKTTTIAWFTLAACLFFLGNIEAQSQRKTIRIEPNHLYQSKLVFSSEIIQLRQPSPFFDIPLVPTAPFLAYSLVWYANDWNESNGVRIRSEQLFITFTDGIDTLNPKMIKVDGHADADACRYVSELYFLENNATQFRLFFGGSAKIDSLEIHFFDPGPSHQSPVGSSQAHTSIPPNLQTSSSCTCPQPAFEGRLDWCPDGSCPTDPTPEFVPDPTHVIIHHTAGTNVASDWAAVVRSIWDFHVNVNGWDDVGYNWLVDPNGVLYEGRGDGRLGAHFCAQNGKTTGICVMGDFTSIQPTAAAVETLADFLAWETCDENIDPLGTSFHSGSGLTLMNISGHRDGCNTSCPGDMFYPLLPDVRQATQTNIDTGCDSEAVAAPTVLAITFVGDNKINLSWQDNSANETAYEVERSDDNDSSFGQIIQLPPNSTAYSDNTVTPGHTYFYRVRAKQGNTFSDYSNVAIAVTGVSAAESVLLNARTVLISPNPTSGQVALNVENQWIGKTKIAVFDVVGRGVLPPFYEVKSGEKQTLQLDLSGLPAGVFWLKMVQGKDAGWFKLVKNQ